ncbi:hypothetical protein J6590_004767 [Homalodisca vitripennis]|nr:hypothetical protein J6590_004767 [Homalodisca vitripennis]
MAGRADSMRTGMLSLTPINLPLTYLNPGIWSTRPSKEIQKSRQRRPSLNLAGDLLGGGGQRLIRCYPGKVTEGHTLTGSQEPPTHLPRKPETRTNFVLRFASTENVYGITTISRMKATGISPSYSSGIVLAISLIIRGIVCRWPPFNRRSPPSIDSSRPILTARACTVPSYLITTT